MKKEVICIVCPIGCKARVTIKNGKVTKIRGAKCRRGKDYVRKEIEAPERDFFTTVRIKDSRIPMLPVRSTQPIPKGKVLGCTLELAKMTVNAPVKANQVIAENLLDLGIKIIATKDIDRAKKLRKNHSQAAN